MTTFFIDLWHDLREKRLWPVAVGLLAAIVAVPVILFKPASAPTAPVTAAPPKNAVATLPVVSVDAGPTEGSRLEAFNEKNPFKPMKDLAKESSTSSASAKRGGGSSSASTSTTPLGASVGGGSSSGGSSSGGSSSSGGTSSSTGGSSPSSGGASPVGPPAIPTVQWFHYTATFSFGEPGKVQPFKSAPSFTLLPDAQHPSVVYMGVGDDHKSAVFFIADPAFTGAGEGKCNAKGAACRFVTLRPTDTRDEETFTSADGSVTYDVKLIRIQREDLATDGSGNPKSSPKAAHKTVEATGAGVTTTTRASESLLPSLLASGPGVAREQK